MEKHPFRPEEITKSCFENKMQHYLLQILNQEEDYVAIPTIMSHLRKLIWASL